MAGVSPRPGLFAADEATIRSILSDGHPVYDAATDCVDVEHLDQALHDAQTLATHPRADAVLRPVVDELVLEARAAYRAKGAPPRVTQEQLLDRLSASIVAEGRRAMPAERRGGVEAELTDILMALVPRRNGEAARETGSGKDTRGRDAVLVSDLEYMIALLEESNDTVARTLVSGLKTWEKRARDKWFDVTVKELVKDILEETNVRSGKGAPPSSGADSAV